MFFQLLKTDKNNYLIYQHLSNIFLFEKNYLEAIEYAKKSIECTDKETIDKKISSLENIARIYSVSNKFKEAVNVMFELLNYDKKNPRYYNILSSLYEDLNDYNNSIIYIRKALELDPNNEDYIHKLEKFESILSAKQ
jgi:tetratricopeptide (TPR) repeat protein